MYIDGIVIIALGILCCTLIFFLIKRNAERNELLAEIYSLKLERSLDDEIRRTRAQYEKVKHLIDNPRPPNEKLKALMAHKECSSCGYDPCMCDQQ